MKQSSMLKLGGSSDDLFWKENVFGAPEFPEIMTP